MSTDSFSVALIALRYPHVRKRVRHGDLSVFEPQLDLTEQETDLIRAAADDFGPATYDAAGSAMFRALVAAESAEAAAEDDTTGFGRIGVNVNPIGSLRNISLPASMFSNKPNDPASPGTPSGSPVTFYGSCCCPPTPGASGVGGSGTY